MITSITEDILENGTIKCTTKTEYKIEIKNYLSFAYSANVLVCAGKE
jgi:hypothetical protein